jgi:hypothetical protein
MRLIWSQNVVDFGVKRADSKVILRKESAETWLNWVEIG